MNKLLLISIFCLLAAIGTEAFAPRNGKTSPRRPAPAPVEAALPSGSQDQQSTQEEDSDGSDNVKGFSKPDSSGSLGTPSEEDAAEESHPAPEPYSFSYSANNDDGSSSNREETGDKDGTVKGFYMLMMNDGTQRRVNYVADKNGFRAEITTNEVGTESKNPADVTIESSAPEVVYPEGPSAPASGSSGPSKSDSGSRNAVSTGSVRTDVVDDSSDEDDFGSASSASSGASKGASAPRPQSNVAPVARRPQQESDSQQTDNNEEIEAPAPTQAPRPRVPAPRPQQPAPATKSATKSRPAPAPQAPTKSRPAPAPRPQPVARPAPQAPTKSRQRPAAAQPAPRPAPRPQQPTKTRAPAPAPTKSRPAPAPRPQPTKGGRPSQSGQKSQAVQPAPVQRRPRPVAPAPVKTAQTDDEEDSFGSENNEQSADSTNSQYMVFPLSTVNRPQIANLINNRRPIAAANRNNGLWLNENQLRNLLAVSRYRA